MTKKYGLYLNSETINGQKHWELTAVNKSQMISILEQHGYIYLPTRKQKISHHKANLIIEDEASEQMDRDNKRRIKRKNETEII